MKRRILSLVLLIVLLSSFSLSTYAAEESESGGEPEIHTDCACRTTLVDQVQEYKAIYTGHLSNVVDYEAKANQKDDEATGWYAEAAWHAAQGLMWTALGDLESAAISANDYTLCLVKARRLGNIADTFRVLAAQKRSSAVTFNEY